MAKECTKWQGALNVLMKQKVNESLLFNTSDRDVNSKTSRFTVPKSGKIVNAIGECGKVTPNCATHEKVELTADRVLAVNEIYDGCECDIDASVIMQDLDITTTAWVNDKLSYAYSVILPKFTDDTDLIIDDITLINTRQQIIATIKNVARRSQISPRELVVAVSTGAYYELLELKVECCDYSLQTSSENSVLANALGVKAIVHVPTDLLSGNVSGEVLPQEETVCFAVYAQGFARSKTYCETPLNVREKSAGVEYVEDKITQLGGKTFIGYDFMESPDFGSVVYEAKTPIVG